MARLRRLRHLCSAVAAGERAADGDLSNASSPAAEDGHHSLVFTDELPTSREPGVSREEARFFKENGLFVKRGLLSAEQVALAQDKLWSEAERLGPGVQRADPSSWLAHPPGTWPEVPVPESARPEYLHYKASRGTRNPTTLGDNLWKNHVDGDSDWLLDLLPKCAPLLFSPPARQSAVGDLHGTLLKAALRTATQPCGASRRRCSPAPSSPR